MINIAICDDEEVLGQNIKKIVENEFSNYTDDFEIKLYTNGKELLENHSKSEFDIVFLDIDMPEISGFDIAKALRDNFHKTFIIFITSHAELVYESMDFQPFHFLRKNCNIPLEQSISEVISKLLKHLNQNEIVELEDNLQGNVLVKVRDIILMSSDKHYINYYIIGKDNPLRIRGTLKEYEQKYKKYNFVRVHKKYLLNMKYVLNIDTSNDEILVGGLNQKIVMSKNFKKDTQEQYKVYLRSLL